VVSDRCAEFGWWAWWVWWACKYPGLGGIFGAIVSSGSLLWIAHHYTKSLRKSEATLEFSKRFQDLIRDQLELNKKFLEHRNGVPNINVGDADAVVWWWRFFDLMLYEFKFFQQGLISEDRFVEWMKWRRHDHSGPESELWETCGVTYPVAWNRWKSRKPMRDNSFIDFLDEIHNPKKGDVEAIVMKAAPCWWRDGRWPN
jgi:hypothetical protein